ncbi:conserved hypothetical protein [Candidatus Nitrosymbiomonas proteolyticus]|uniref:Uncharacterized protein n=1 Tax=Candidatus Nitrosymbiomonas proteolyticus TaxID=2608984 RepID=A0A809R4T6_9BACT|nr:conserved hypothetical protein [Candidatus Nitrosymbiomonas proteolyticus]
MKLIVSRNQSDMKGLLGGHKGVKFNLRAHVQLTPEEQQLAERYMILKKWLPTELAAGMMGAKKVPEFGDLLTPVAFEYESLEVLLEKEEELKKVCAGVKNYIDVARSFGGQDVFEF